MLLAGLAAAAASVVAFHDHLEDRSLLGDPLREARLRRTPLRELDSHWERAPRRAALVVCLTTLPSRIAGLETTLKSLLDQELPPARVRLHLPRRSRRENSIYVLPAVLTGLRSLEIVDCEDLGPLTKLAPALLACAADQPLFVCDDDRVYNRHLLRALDALAAERPDDALGCAGWIVPADLTDRASNPWAALRRRPPVPWRGGWLREAREVDVLQGLAGYVVRPRFFEARALLDQRSAPPEVFTVDDVWVSAHCRAARYVVPIARSNFPRHWGARSLKRGSLGFQNRGSGDPERRPNTIAMRHLREFWRVGGANLLPPGRTTA